MAGASISLSGASISLSGDEADALRGYWGKLSAAGTVVMPLEKQGWGDEFGMCTDQFGVPLDDQHLPAPGLALPRRRRL